MTEFLPASSQLRRLPNYLREQAQYRRNQKVKAQRPEEQSTGRWFLHAHGSLIIASQAKADSAHVAGLGTTNRSTPRWPLGNYPSALSSDGDIGDYSISSRTAFTHPAAFLFFDLGDLRIATTPFAQKNLSILLDTQTRGEQDDVEVSPF
jgi:hypothetical protein